MQQGSPVFRTLGRLKLLALRRSPPRFSSVFAERHFGGEGPAVLPGQLPPEPLPDLQRGGAGAREGSALRASRAVVPHLPTGEENMSCLGRLRGHRCWLLVVCMSRGSNLR